VSENKSNLEGEVDALFKLPLAEFIGARNDLARRLKRDGQADDANFVKALDKPSVSAWVVNQLRWNHPEAFDQLLAADQRFRQAQTSPTAGHTAAKIADMREARREALSHLSELAASLLRDAGHNPTPDTIRRISTTLEAVSARASLSSGPTPGRLTRDVDPPGFESLASLMAGAGAMKANEELTRATHSPKSRSDATPMRQQSSPSGDAQKELNEERRARIASAKVSLQDAKRSLTDAKARAQRLEAAQKKAHAGARHAEKELRESEERFKKASAASRDAAERLQSIAADAKEAAKAVEDAKRNVDTASQELESLLRYHRTREPVT
jgi:DNA repair exonuclease SbcCD ATPase subunit